MRKLFPVILFLAGLGALASVLIAPLSMEADFTGAPPPPPPPPSHDDGMAPPPPDAMVLPPPEELRVERAIMLPANCEGTALNDPRCDPVGAALEALGTADLAYNRVTEMTRGEPVTVSLALSPGAGPATEALTGLSGDIAGGTTKVSRQMEAHLSGAGFSIDPPGPQLKKVFPGVITRWDWTVTPERAGDERPLTLDVHAVVAVDDAEVASVPVRTFRDVIAVKVTIIERLREAAADSKILTALGGSAAMLWGGIEFFRRRKWKIEKPDKEDA